MTSDEEENAVRQLGDLIGYGRMMQLAEQIWRKKLKADGLEGGEHTTGPMRSLVLAGIGDFCKLRSANMFEFSLTFD